MTESRSGEADAGKRQRQRIEQVPGSRRARLTPAPGTDPSPDVADKPARPDRRGAKGPNDDQLFRDIPPHY